MAAPLLMVELPTQSHGRPEAAALIAACSAALESGSCELSEGQTDERAAGIAVVSWRGAEQLHALVEVGRKRQNGQAWLADDLTFQPQDATVERFRAVGLAIATLFREMDRARQSAEAAATRAEARAKAGAPDQAPRTGPKPPAPGRVEPNTAVLPRRSAGRPSGPPWFSLGAVTGADFQSGAIRLGAEAHAYWSPLPWPVFLTVAGRYEQASLEPSVRVRWTTIGLALGAFVTLPARIRLSAQVGAVMENRSALVVDGTSNGTTQDSLWLPGAASRLDVVWPADGNWGLYSGLFAERLDGATLVTLHGVQVGTLGATSAGVGLGLEWRPF